MELSAKQRLLSKVSNIQKSFISAGEGGLVWDGETLSEFLAKPKSYIKGTKMTFAGLKKQSDIDAIVAYLGSFKD